MVPFEPAQTPENLTIKTKTCQKCFLIKFNSVIVAALIYFACFKNEREIPRTVVYHFGTTFRRRASKSGSRRLHGCINFFRTKILQGVQGHVQKCGPYLYHAQLYEEVTDADILAE